MNYQVIAAEILKYLGGAENIDNYTNCMTRLRVYVHNHDAVDFAALKDIAGVMGVVDADQIQIIVGPGHASSVKDEVDMLIAATTPVEQAQVVGNETIKVETTEPVANAEPFDTSETQLTVKESPEHVAESEPLHKTEPVVTKPTEQTAQPSPSPKPKPKAKETLLTDIKKFCQKLGSIFVPLMPFFIIFGLVATTIFYMPYLPDGNWSKTVQQILGQIQTVLIYILIPLIGYHSAKTFAATPIYGAVIGAVTLAIAQVIGTINVFGIDLQLFHGIILTTILVSATLAKIETFLKKVLPTLLRFYLTPMVITVIGATLAALFLPLMATIMATLIYFVIDILLGKLGAVGAFLLAVSFLPLVLLGIHQALYPLHIQLLLVYGGNALFPILAMAGAGLLGMALALYLTEKESAQKTNIASVLPASILGMNEQLIYGIALPRVYPLITGAIGGALGAAYLGYLYQQGNYILSLTFGPSGLLLLPFFRKEQILSYLIALGIAYVGGFICTLLFGRKKLTGTTK